MAETYEFAEPENGGGCFIPRSGDQARSMALLKTAAGWYGAKVVPDRPITVKLVANWTPEMSAELARMREAFKHRGQQEPS